MAIDLNKPRIHDALCAVLALATAPGGFTVGQLAAKVCTMTGQTSYTVRQAAYDLRKIRGKRLIDKPDPAASPWMGRKPKTWTAVDRDYEQIRIDMQTLFGHLGIITAAAAA